MDQNPDVIRHNIEETRSALTEKLECLEQEVFGTVRDATQAVTATVENVKEAVTGTVENVKEKVHETVQSVKETFDLNRQVEQHPWATFGGSVAAGFLLGNLLPGDRTTQAFQSLSSSSAIDYSSTHATQRQEMSSRSERESSQGGFLSSLLEQFRPELEKVKGMAIGMAVGLVRDAVKDRIPEGMVRDFEQLANNVTTKLGGQPVQGPVLDTDCCQGGATGHTSAASAGL